MIDPAGRPLRYNTKDNLLNPHFLAFGDQRRDWLAPILKH
jgi:3'(2'), 5'-bisphosphate nucleotidase